MSLCFLCISEQHGEIALLYSGGLAAAHYGYTHFHNFPCGSVINLPPTEQWVSMVVNLCE